MIKPVQIPHQIRKSPMQRELEQIPFNMRFAIPFIPLRHLSAHEEEFLAGIGHQVGIQEPEIGEFLPIRARHFIEQAPFAVDRLVVGKDRHEFF